MITKAFSFYVKKTEKKNSKKNLHTKKHIQRNTEHERKKDQKNKKADISTHQIGTPTTNAQPKDPHVLIVQEGSSWMFADLNIEDNKKLEKLRKPKRPNKVIQTIR